LAEDFGSELVRFSPIRSELRGRFARIAPWASRGLASGFGFRVSRFGFVPVAPWTPRQASIRKASARVSRVASVAMPGHVRRCFRRYAGTSPASLPSPLHSADTSRYAGTRPASLSSPLRSAETSRYAGTRRVSGSVREGGWRFGKMRVAGGRMDDGNECCFEFMISRRWYRGGKRQA